MRLQCLLDLLFAKTNPKLVAYQMDLLWTVHPGQDQRRKNALSFAHAPDDRLPTFAGPRGDFGRLRPSAQPAAARTSHISVCSVLAMISSFSASDRSQK